MKTTGVCPTCGGTLIICTLVSSSVRASVSACAGCGRRRVTCYRTGLHRFACALFWSGVRALLYGLSAAVGALAIYLFVVFLLGFGQ
jgi:hypothetical protein